MAKKDLGKLHTCDQCNARFFDMNKKIIACPKCAFVESAARPKRKETTAKKSAAKKPSRRFEEIDDVDALDSGDYDGDFDEELDADFVVDDEPVEDVPIDDE
jgi:hypothetical protein